jgi:RNA polymerase sigma factor (sigma-70 family)
MHSRAPADRVAASTDPASTDEARPDEARPDRARRAFAERSVGYLSKLLRYARVELGAQEALGLIPPGELQPEDIVDAALLDALERADEAPSEGLYPWLRGFVRRAIEREVRAARPRRRYRYLEAPVRPPRVEDEGLPRRLVEVLPDPKSPIPDDVVESREFQRALLELLAQLPDSWREAFMLQVSDGLSVEQVAAMEYVTPAEVRRRLRHAREFLRARLAQDYLDEPIAPPTEAVFERLHSPEATAEHVERIGHQLAAAGSQRS